MNDNVNHPAHYTDGNIEVIDFIEDKKLNYHLGNAVKYISRAGKKDPEKYTEDLQKAVYEVSAKLYQQAAPQQGAPDMNGAPDMGGAQQNNNGNPNVYDADFTDVDGNN